MLGAVLSHCHVTRIESILSSRQDMMLHSVAGQHDIIIVNPA